MQCLVRIMQIAAVVEGALREKKDACIHCQKGLSRSPSAAVALFYFEVVRLTTPCIQCRVSLQRANFKNFLPVLERLKSNDWGSSFSRHLVFCMEALGLPRRGEM